VFRCPWITIRGIRRYEEEKEAKKESIL